MPVCLGRLRQLSCLRAVSMLLKGGNPLRLTSEPETGETYSLMKSKKKNEPIFQIY